MAQERSFPSLAEAVPDVLGTPPPALYHYTTREGVLGILQDRAFWATSIRHLNDTTEFSYALPIVEDVCKARSRTRTSLAERQLLAAFHSFGEQYDFPVPGFVFSMSEEEDALGQWRAYGRPGNNYALGLSPGRLQQHLTPRGYYLARCRYIRQEQEELVDCIISAAFAHHASIAGDTSVGDDLKTSAASMYFMLLMLQATALIKDPAFLEEKEWRLVRMGAESPLSFRAANSMIVPYQKVSLPSAIESLPFMSVTIGPTPHPAADEASLLLVENHLQTSFLEVKHSRIPFRSW